MPKFNVKIDRSRVTESSVEIEVSAKDECAAQEKAEKMVEKAIVKGDCDSEFDWEETNTDDSYEYEVTKL
jgi:hypothetical protein